MARYIGPKTKIARKFGAPIFGEDKYLERKKRWHSRRVKRSWYAVQLAEKQKLRYTYGILEHQLRKLFKIALRTKGITGVVLLQLLESRLDNLVYRLGLTSSRASARQLVTHCHITVNGKIVNIPSSTLKIGDIISVKENYKNHAMIKASLIKKPVTPDWLTWNDEKMTGTLNSLPQRDKITENINEQLIVEWYSK